MIQSQEIEPRTSSFRRKIGLINVLSDIREKSGTLRLLFVLPFPGPTLCEVQLTINWIQIQSLIFLERATSYDISERFHQSKMKRPSWAFQKEEWRGAILRLENLTGFFNGRPHISGLLHPPTPPSNHNMFGDSQSENTIAIPA